MAYVGKPGREFADIDLVQTHLNQASEFVSRQCGLIYRNSTEGALRYFDSIRFDSPLEVLFWLWWEACLMTSNHLDDILHLERQAEVVLGSGRYRVDFVVHPIPYEFESDPHWKPIAVELDGHEFHERTPEQVAYRDRRDRDLQDAGWRVLHYSFREFTARPKDAVGEVMVFARDQWNQCSITHHGKAAPSCLDPEV